MANSHHHEPTHEEEEDYYEIEDSNSEDFDSDDDSEEDPTYDNHLDKVQSKFSNLSIKKSKSRLRANAESEIDDGDALEFDIKDVKDLEQVQKIIDAGQIEKLKVEQCKVYLRNHGLRLTGKKDILIQRIKEHIEILNGGGERKYPPSSFVFNCKGDACMGDVVMFEQTVYDGYSIASRSATGPPSGKRTIAGRIVKESYGAAKQQHTFTVEVLWSKGHKPLPPLHPLLIKGRNLYRLNTMRQRWEDEAQRQRVLNDKHSRGSVARSNRETRIQEKTVKKTLKSMRVFPKEGQNSRECQNTERPHINGSKVQQRHSVARQIPQQQTRQEPLPEVHVEFKENLYPDPPRAQPFQDSRRNEPVASYQEPRSRVYPSHIGPPKFQHSKPAKSTYFENSFNGNPEVSFNSQQTQQDLRHLVSLKNMEQSFLPYSNSHPFQQKRSTNSNFHFHQEQRSYLSEVENSVTMAQYSNKATSHNFYGRNHHVEPHSKGSLQRPSHAQQQLCRYYPQGRCYYGNQCKFLHE